MTSFPKTEYWRPLLPNDESVDETTNPYFKTLSPHLLQKVKHILFWSNIFFNMLQYPCVHRNLQKHEVACEWNIQKY